MMAISLGCLYLGSRHLKKILVRSGLLWSEKGAVQAAQCCPCWSGCAVLPLLRQRPRGLRVSSKGTPASPCPGRELLVD